MRRSLAAVLLLLAAGTAPAAAASFPGYINYQGKLGNPAGNPLTGTYSFRFKFYDRAAGGTLLATDANYTGANAVTVTNGLYSVQIGSLTAGGLPESVFHGPETWLEIDVNLGANFTGFETLSPRERLAAVPFAFRALNAEKLGTGVAIATFTADGNLTLPYGVTAATMTTTGAITAGAAGYQFGGRPAATAITSPLDNIIRLFTGVSQAELNVTDTAVVLGEPGSGAPPAFKTLKATSGDGPNNTGSSLIIAAGAGSGTGLGGSIIFQSSTGTVAGSVTQAYREHARITPFGGFGIGTASPAAKLHMSSGTLLIDGNAATAIIAGGIVQLGAVGGNGKITTTQNDLEFAPAGGVSRFYDGSTNEIVQVYNGAAIGIQMAGNGLVFFNTGGDFGIGTSAPATKLDVNGNAQFGTTRKSTMTATGEIVSPSSITASAFFGDGSALTGIGAGNVGLASTQTFSGANTFTSLYGIHNSTYTSPPAATGTNTNWAGCNVLSTVTMTSTMPGSTIKATLSDTVRMSSSGNYLNGGILMDGTVPYGVDPTFPVSFYDQADTLNHSIHITKIWVNVSSGTHSFCYGYGSNVGGTWNTEAKNATFFIEEVK